MAKNTDKNQGKSLVARGDGALNTRSVESASTLLNLREKVKQNTALVSDEWLDRLIKWADENKIPDYLFPRDREKVRNIKKICLSGYYIKHRFPNELVNLPFLKTLLLDYVELYYEDIELICKLKCLKSLSLNCNDLYLCNDLPDEFANLQNLEYLWLSFNVFATFPLVITKLTKLKSLSLNQDCYKKLSSLPDEFANLQNLAMVSLLGNNFARFPQVLFDLPKLEYLWIDEYLITPSIAKELQRKGVQVHYE